MVIGQAISDKKSEEVSDLDEYLLKGFMGAVAGAAGSAVSASLVPGAIASTMMGAGFSGAVETVVENAVLGKVV